jgi:hypothetical protein
MSNTMKSPLRLAQNSQISAHRLLVGDSRSTIIKSLVLGFRLRTLQGNGM